MTDLRDIYPYLPPPCGFKPTVPANDINPPQYDQKFHPLAERLREQRWIGRCTNSEYFGIEGYVAYTQVEKQSRTEYYSYYRYDRFKRIVETGIVKPTNMQHGNTNHCRHKTNAEMSAEMLALSERTNVMVAVYNDENPFTTASYTTHDLDKIDRICYYTQIDADTPCDASGVYHPAGPWYEITYQYDHLDNISIHTRYRLSTLAPIKATTAETTAGQTTTSAPAIPTPPISLQAAEEKTTDAIIEIQQTTTENSDHTSCSPLRHQLAATDYEELYRIGNLVHNAVFSKPLSAGDYTAMFSTQIPSENTTIHSWPQTTAQLFQKGFRNHIYNNILAFCHRLLTSYTYLFTTAAMHTMQSYMVSILLGQPTNPAIHYGHSPPRMRLHPP